jgi:uncharacterized RDD family membrane protein YckC
VVLGRKPQPFALTPDEEPFELGEYMEFPERRLPIEHRVAQNPGEAVARPRQEIRWGGFLRRTGAFLVDLIIIGLLSTMMCLISFVAYKVGLYGHGRAITLQNSVPLIVFLTLGFAGLTTGYFVLFHGMEGKTVGKWLFGMRVVGAERRAITYGQAFLRWIGLVGFAPAGLGFLWIIWSREKRGWHDYLARTWVIRD